MPESSLDGNVFPEIFCIEAIHCLRPDSGGYEYRASLYHDRASIMVTFSAAQRDLALKRGRFVAVDWLPETVSDCGAVRGGGLHARDCAVGSFNPFRNVPHSWCADRHQIECVRDLWDSSSQQLRKLLFETFWKVLHARHAHDSGGACER